jgi:hypothetical protein
MRYAICDDVTELPGHLERSVRRVPVARPVLRVTQEPTETLAPRASMAKQPRMGRMADAALLALQGPKAPPALNRRNPSPKLRPSTSTSNCLT